MSDGLPNPQRFFAFFTISIAMIMAVLDGSIVSVALPTIGQDLSVTPAAAIWIVNSYQIAITVSLLPLATLGDIVGYRRVYGWGLAVFTLASFACATSHTLGALAIARVVQGLGAAGIMSVNIALIRFIFPKARLGAGVGYASLIVAASSAAGPSVASAILLLAHWQWLFLVNLPLGVLALIVGARALPATPRSGRVLDTASVLLNVAFFGPLIAGLTLFGDRHAPRASLALIGVALAIGVVFVLRERRVATPILPVDLLAQPVFSLSITTSICSFAAQTMTFLVLPFYFEKTLGHSGTVTGLLMTPWPLMTALVAPGAGRLSDRFSPERIAAAGLGLLGAGLASLHWLGDAPSAFDIGWRLALCGLGFGLFQSPNNRVIAGSAPRERSGGASGIQAMGRLLGQSLGAVVVAIVFGNVGAQQAGTITLIGAARSRPARSR